MVEDYTQLFSALAGAGATFVALTGGLVIQRLLTLQSEISGHAGDLARAEGHVRGAEADLRQAEAVAVERYVRLVSADERFLDELYGNATGWLDRPSEQSDQSEMVRLDRLGSLFEPAGEQGTTAQRVAAMKPLWAFALDAVRLARRHEEELVSDELSPGNLADVYPEANVEGPWFDSGRVWEGLAHRVGRDHYADTRGGDPTDYVHSRTKRLVDEGVGRALTRMRDGLTTKYRDSAWADVRRAEGSLERRKAERASITVPKFESSLVMEGGLTILLIVLMLVMPVLYLTPGSGSAPEASAARWVTAAFLLGAAAYAAYFVWRVGVVWARTKGSRPRT